MEETRKVQSADEELISVLADISAVSKRLANRLVQIEQQSKSMEGVRKNEQIKRNRTDHQRIVGYCIIFE